MATFCKEQYLWEMKNNLETGICYSRENVLLRSEAFFSVLLRSSDFFLLNFFLISPSFFSSLLLSSFWCLSSAFFRDFFSLLLVDCLARNRSGLIALMRRIENGESYLSVSLESFSFINGFLGVDNESSLSLLVSSTAGLNDTMQRSRSSGYSYTVKQINKCLNSLKKLWNMFIVNNKDIRPTSYCYLYC